ncbi:hypothetical protein CCACVL1_29735 [Corchorus capsularis]|uniref:Uncharacterized protein n=1 Tax=Corchorus capsularis TaxID=210143 RepID=A0A1R3G0K1_COCAP|nr:hypothetical protein CCACVL1_29735 [Corchorus capsularis]
MAKANFYILLLTSLRSSHHALPRPEDQQ